MASTPRPTPTTDGAWADSINYGYPGGCTPAYPYWEEIDVTLEELGRLIENKEKIKINC